MGLLSGLGHLMGIDVVDARRNGKKVQEIKINFYRFGAFWGSCGASFWLHSKLQQAMAAEGGRGRRKLAGEILFLTLSAARSFGVVEARFSEEENDSVPAVWKMCVGGCHWGIGVSVVVGNGSSLLRWDCRIVIVPGPSLFFFERRNWEPGTHSGKQNPDCPPFATPYLC